MNSLRSSHDKMRESKQVPLRCAPRRVDQERACVTIRGFCVSIARHPYAGAESDPRSASRDADSFNESSWNAAIQS